MFLLILYIIYYLIFKIYDFLLYIIYKYITWADICILSLYNMLPIIYKNKEVIEIHRLIYVYCVLFPWYVLVYIFTTVSYCVYLFFIGELIKCIKLVKKLVILLLFFYVIGILKVLFMLNWLLLYKFIVYYNSYFNTDRDTIITILLNFFLDIIDNYKQNAYKLLNTVLNKHNSFLIQTDRSYLLLFLCDLLCLLILFCIVYNVYIQYKICYMQTIQIILVLFEIFTYIYL